MNKTTSQVIQMFIGLGLLIWALYPRTPAATKREKTLACDMKMIHRQYDTDVTGAHHLTEPSDNRRIIAIGDVHGSYEGLLEVLHAAKVTKTGDSCEWADQDGNGVVVVQQGDLVDRGPQAWEALQCLRHLQEEAPKHNSKVVRIIGNHELWWLNGYFHHRNVTADTREKIINTIQAIVLDIEEGKLQAAYVHKRNDVPILFIHAGVRPTYYKHLKKTLRADKGSGKSDNSAAGTVSDELTADEVATAVNVILRDYIASCDGTFPCAGSNDEFFEAGPDRGGGGLGGPLWTDFSVLEQADQQNKAPPGFIQVVGHTMAHCYHPSRIGVHPPAAQAECSAGLIRATDHLQAVCVDAGMYCGARAYLEIGPDAHFRAYERYRGDPKRAAYAEYQVTDLTERVCKN